MSKKLFLSTLVGSSLLALGSAWAGPISFSGNSSITDEALSQISVKLVQSESGLTPSPDGKTYYLGSIDAQELAPEAISQILRNISAHYQEAGILATRAVVTKPGYKASREGKALEIKVIEGKIAKTRVVNADPNSGVSQAKLDRIEAIAPLGDGDAIDARSLDASLGMLNRFTRQQIQPVFVPEAGDLVLEYRVRQLREFAGGITFDNYGSERTGKERVSLSLDKWNALSTDDHLSFKALSSTGGESSYLGLDYMLPLDSVAAKRLRFNAYYSEYNAEDIGLGVGGLDFEGESAGVGITYEKTLWNGVGSYLDGTFGLRFLDVSQDQSSVGIPEQSTQYLLPSMGLRYTKSEANSRYVAGAKIEGNLSSVASTASGARLDRLGRLGAEDSFVTASVYSAYVTYLDGFFGQANNRTHELNVLATGSTSFGNRLPPSFLNVLGGYNSIRGYPVGVLSGDSSVFVKLDYKRHLNRGERLTDPEAPKPNWNFSVGAFTDFGVVNNVDALAFEQNETLWSVGLGFDAVQKDGFNLGLQYGWAISDVATASQNVNSGDGEFYITASYKW